MKTAVQIILISFMTFFFGAALGAKTQRMTLTYAGIGTAIAIVIIATITML